MHLALTMSLWIVHIQAMAFFISNASVDIKRTSAEWRTWARIVMPSSITTIHLYESVDHICIPDSLAYRRTINHSKHEPHIINWLHRWRRILAFRTKRGAIFVAINSIINAWVIKSIGENAFLTEVELGTAQRKPTWDTWGRRTRGHWRPPSCRQGIALTWQTTGEEGQWPA